MKTLLIIFSLLLVLLIAGLWVGPGSYPDRWRLGDRTIVQEQENTDKQAQINKIQNELDDITSSKEALEERARSELGMTKTGETFFEVIMQPETKKSETKKPVPTQDVAEELDSPDIEKSQTETQTN